MTDVPPPDAEAVLAALRGAGGRLYGADVRLRRIYRDLKTSGDVPSSDEWQELLACLGMRLGDARRATAEVSELLGLGSAQDRVLRYLRVHVGTVVQGDRLAGVAGISAWARRVRELRVERGWAIESHLQGADLNPDEYVLTADQPDSALAEAWRLAKRVWGMNASGKARLLEYLKAVSPKPAPGPARLRGEDQILATPYARTRRRGLGDQVECRRARTPGPARTVSPR